MLLMSYVGKQAQEDLIVSIRLDIDLETTYVVAKLQCYSINYYNVQSLNVLWNSESRRIMLVDLKQSEILAYTLAL
jgi:hypothetical protein